MGLCRCPIRAFGFLIRLARFLPDNATPHRVVAPHCLDGATARPDAGLAVGFGLQGGVLGAKSQG